MLAAVLVLVEPGETDSGSDEVSDTALRSVLGTTGVGIFIMSASVVRAASLYR